MADVAERDYAVNVAKNVKRYREKCRMSRRELSEAIGGSHSYVFHVESMKKMPSLLMGMRLARILKVEPEDLLR